ncbi:hypothetical protein PYW07_003143 [Mythimna separata]|uniref:Uncharacterized protein n=1 Tax=Mythimna separata TaxID=271217 RepID=A0AAD8DQZ8_MYTSE|nr:hypothetical protein PYW07_003143 [Mythimna separata]
MLEYPIKSMVVIALAIFVLRTYSQTPSFTNLVDPVNIHKCAAQPDILNRICCVFPPFFTREIAKQCGGGVLGEFVDEKHNVSAFTRVGFDCTHWYCVLDKYNLLDEQGVFDLEKYYAHLDLWVSLNPMFADPMLEAKVFCKDEFRPEFPIQTCQFFNFQACIRNYINVECPIYIPSSECDEKKEFLKDCKQFFHKRK